MKYYLIAGEASGDLHGASLLKELKKNDPEAIFRGFGGDLMKAQGMALGKHYSEMAFMGFLEVILNIGKVIRNISDCKKDILSFNPDLVIFIDYPGFNFRIASFVKEKGYRTAWFISPKLWAWKESRVHLVKKYIDLMLLIFPFEMDFYKKWNYEKAVYIGNPLLDAIKEFKADPDFKSTYKLNDKPVIALLPGSRRQEINSILPLMLQQVKEFPDYQFALAKAPGFDLDYYTDFIKDLNVKIINDQTYDLLNVSTAALVTSGTATLETALFKVPQIVCYTTSKITYLIAKSLIKIRFISLVNLIMDKEIVKELIQDDLNFSQIKAELTELLPGHERRNRMLSEYEDLHRKMGREGASALAAREIIKLLS